MGPVTRHETISSVICHSHTVGSLSVRCRYRTSGLNGQRLYTGEIGYGANVGGEAEKRGP